MASSPQPSPPEEEREKNVALLLLGSKEETLLRPLLQRRRGRKLRYHNRWISTSILLCPSEKIFASAFWAVASLLMNAISWRIAKVDSILWQLLRGIASMPTRSHSDIKFQKFMTLTSNCWTIHHSKCLISRCRRT